MRVIGDKVRLEEKIGSGGMGDVHRAKHLVTGADVAVKILEPCAHPDDDAIERFRSEARVSALLAHRSIVRVYDLLEEPDGTLALVMELLVGRTLEQRIARDGALDPEIAVAIALPVLGAIDHAHAVGVVHRDVKPANVFLAVEPDGHVTPKLLDFGVAKSAASGVRTIDGRVLGTARYMSPEQARGVTLDGRSDVFSMAVVLYEAMTGVSPFAATEASKALDNVLELTVDPDERIPPRVWLVLQKALSKQPYARHASASAFATALAAAVGKKQETLSTLLRDAPPPLPRLETPTIAISDAARARPGSSRRVWPIAIAFAAGAAVAASFALRRPPTKSTTILTSPPAITSMPLAPSPLAAPSVSTTSNAATHASAPHAPSSVPHTKRIATTPGF